MTPKSRANREETVLVLQGGGALGAYQAGAYEALTEHGFTPHWIAGISIGAINGAIIAGNEPENRVKRLRIFLGARVVRPAAAFRSSAMDIIAPLFNDTSALLSLFSRRAGFLRAALGAARLRTDRCAARCQLLFDRAFDPRR